jgi:hypothetical protein
MAINFPINPTVNQTYTLNNTTWAWSGTAWNVVSSQGQLIINNSFSSIRVSGQSNIDADSSETALTLIAGNNVTITTDGIEKSILISSTGSTQGAQSDSFSTISVSGQSNVVADSATDTLTLAAGSGITLTTNPTTDTVTIAASGGVTAFTNLSDAGSLTVDRFYLPAITMLTVTNSGASSYRFDQYGATDNPTIYAINGTTIAFNLAATGHPFLIQTPGGVNYNTGLTHVSTAGVVSTGSAAQGKDSGTLYWKIPTDISGGYRYQCSVHAPMVGSITIKVFATV